MGQVATVKDQAPAQVIGAASMMEIISKAAADPEVNVDKLERLMAMAERVKAKDAEQAFNAAMTLAQSEMGRISADANNPQTRSKYASYAALDRVVRPIYTKHGFALSFDTSVDATPEHVRVQCHVSHKDGHARTYQVDMPADGKGAKGGDVMTKTHAVGAAMSYGSRYLLKMIFNVAVGEDDNDGNNPSDEGLIDDDQVEKIFHLLKITNSDTTKFLKYMGTESVPDIRKKDFEKAIIALNSQPATKKQPANA